MLNLTRLHLGIAHESQFQGLGITLRSLSQKRPPACYGDSGGTIHVPHEKENFDAPEVASIGRATRTSRSRERARTSHPHYGARSSFPARPSKNIFSRRHAGIGKSVPLIRQARPIRLRPLRGDVEAKLSAVQRQSEEGMQHSQSLPQPARLAAASTPKLKTMQPVRQGR